MTILVLVIQAIQVQAITLDRFAIKLFLVCCFRHFVFLVLTLNVLNAKKDTFLIPQQVRQLAVYKFFYN
jgi:hypothetical protein